MKHITIDARDSGTSTGRYVDKLIEHLHALRSEYDTSSAMPLRFTILTKPHRLDYFANLAPGFTCLASPFKEFTFQEQIDLKRQIDELKPDLVHFGAVQQPAWYSGKSVTTMHDLTTIRFRNPAKNQLVFTFKQQVYKWLNRRVAHKSLAIITPTEFVKQDVVAFSGIKPEKVTVTYEAADHLPEPALPVDGVGDKPFIMYVGRPTPHKNLERLIEAFVLLKQDHPDLQLVLVGKRDANYDRIAESVKARSISDIIFAGFLSDQQLRWLYEHCRAYVFPSLSEGFGLPPVEAMLHGAPLVSSNATCLPEVSGGAALYFDPLDVQDMAVKIDTMLSDQPTREAAIAKGYSQAAKYSWRRMAEQTLEVYKKALDATHTTQQS